MFVAKYPDWVASVQFQDGHRVYFDGPKDLFKYLFDLTRYAPGRQREQIAAVQVTEYYGLHAIDAHGAWFVVGSDVLGPMGHELVPLASQAEVDEFRADHQGRQVLRFDEVTPELILQLDQGGEGRQ
jgi:hypothetical protein